MGLALAHLHDALMNRTSSYGRQFIGDEEMNKEKKNVFHDAYCYNIVSLGFMNPPTNFKIPPKFFNLKNHLMYNYVKCANLALT